MILYCARCADVEVSASFIEYGRSLCASCFFELKGIDDALREATGDPDFKPTSALDVEIKIEQDKHERYPQNP
jgi:hypothetical protein